MPRTPARAGPPARPWAGPTAAPASRRAPQLVERGLHALPPVFELRHALAALGHHLGLRALHEARVVETFLQRLQLGVDLAPLLGEARDLGGDVEESRHGDPHLDAVHG